ncbi:MAG: beta-propeller domain-containing protein [Verrucomicrobiota bacterium]
MKTLGRWTGLLAGLAWVAALVQAEPVIRSIRPKGTNLVVTVAVDDVARRITVEGRPRLGPGGWLPRATRWVAEREGEVTVEVPMTSDLEILRVRSEAERDLPLPARFFADATRFDGQRSVSTNPPAIATPDLPVNTLGPGVPNDSKLSEGAGGGRAVVESDIWQVSGSTLFFFNNVRGLQVIDLDQPDRPVLRGTLPMAAQGEQMYLLPGGQKGESWLALLASDACDGQTGGVVMVRVADLQPAEVTRIPYDGQVRESRLVGSVLYIASQRWGPASDPAANGAWRAETLVQSIDLADPAKPVSRVAAMIPAATDAIQATDRFLLVATSGPASGKDDPTQMPWMRPGVHGVTVFDISDPSGVVVQKGTALVRGRVQDKFKMGLSGDTLTAISQRDPEFRLVTRTNRVVRTVGSNGERLDPPVIEEFVYNDYVRVTPSQTWLETFSLAVPEKPEPLGSLKVITDESLFATRYVGNRAYVVTFRVIDPLWVIDLSDPRNPAIKGELQIPGYSSYLEPIGNDRLMAVGVEQSRATVALFDVQDAAKPRQLSKVYLGTGWSWSEANSDEKAFKYLPTLGMALVPWQGTEGNAWTQGMQIVDVAGDKLVKRGLVQHSMAARRATVLGDRLVSLSGQELLVVDATDRDQPVVKADLDLSFPAERVRVDGDRLDVVGSASGKGPRLSRVKASVPDAPIGSLDLPPFTVVGMERFGATLHLLQFEPDTYRQEPRVMTNVVVGGKGDAGGWITNHIVFTNWNQVVIPGRLHVTEVGFDGDQPLRLGASSIERPEGYYGGSMKGLLAGVGSIVWVESDAGGILPWARPGGGMLWDGPAILPGRRGGWWGWRNTLALVTEDASSPGRPRLAATLVLGGKEGVSGFSGAHVAEGKVHVSHSEWIVREEEGPKDRDGNPTRWWTTETRHVLDVVDVTNPSEPLLRKPLGLPAELAGVSHRGALLYTTGATTNSAPGTTQLTALAYDGLVVAPVAEASVGDGSGAVVLEGGRILTVEPALKEGTKAQLVSWALGSDARWVRQESLPLRGSWATLRRLGPLVLADTDVGMSFFRSTADGMVALGEGPRPCGFWGDWAAGDAGADAVAWLPRGDSGLVRLAPMATGVGR